jgi:hypothetical protein
MIGKIILQIGDSSGRNKDAGNTIFRYISIFLLIIFLGACEPPRMPPMQLEIFEPACSRQCWQEIEIGADTSKVVSLMSAWPNYYVFDYEGKIYHNARHPNGYSVEFSSQDNIVIGIVLSSSSTFNLSLSKVIEELGEPPYIYVDYTRAIEIRKFYPFIRLYYPATGFEFEAHLDNINATDNELSACINPETLIHLVQIQSNEEDIRPFILNLSITPILNQATLDVYVSSLAQWSDYRCFTWHLEY